MKIFTFYKKAALYPSLFVLFFSTVNSILANYVQGESFNSSAVVTTLVGTLIFALLMSSLSLTIFLNKIKKLNKYLIWNILSWLVLPFSYLIIVGVHEMKIRMRFNLGFGGDFWFLIVLFAPYIIGLLYTFLRYRQQISTAGND